MLLNEAQIASFRRLNRLLRKLKIIGVLEYTVVQKTITEFGKPTRYLINVTRYHPRHLINEVDCIEEEQKQLYAIFNQLD
jgi:hypothetical protein